MRHDPVRDRKNYRRCVDIIDPHNGIGALCELDLVETPMAVMTQGARAEDQIRTMRQLIKQIRETATDKSVLDLINGFEIKQGAERKKQQDHMADYKAAQEQ
jgi:hypothetical protein